MNGTHNNSSTHLGDAYEFSGAQALRPKQGQRSLGRQKRRRCERIEWPPLNRPDFVLLPIYLASL